MPDFRDLTAYPTQEELLGGKSFLRRNVIDRSFDSVEEYLDIQFRLLREDFVANLREAISCFKTNAATKDLYIYESIRISKSYENVLKIKVPSVQNDDDKKFMTGSLLLFTKNKFKTIVLGKVERKLHKECEVIIELINNTDKVNLNTTYTMAECSQYFDPYLQVLSALKKFSANNFPMEKYIVHLDRRSVSMPKYLRKNLNAKHKIDFYNISPPFLTANHATMELRKLNEYQLQAFIAALTQEFVVIQGPPGTGKTHLGLKIASTLIQNSHLWYNQTPLLVVSHKNDALDQFLEGLLPITDRLVRVGSQSKSEKLKNFNVAYRSADGVLKKRPRHEYLQVMRNSLVVGMTTSLAARWKKDLEQLMSPIVIVEEAAEILEAHVLAALTSDCQHLILVGDHKQLQPMTADYNIGKKYHLEISLFERMVMNQVQHYQLKVQHRMRPEICDLLRDKIYPFLEDHDSVKGRFDVLGINRNLFFLNHQYPEETCNITTKKNVFEASFLIALARYLILNGHRPNEIVILATYTGQIQELEKLAQNEELVKDVKISTLDGFQGQESEIVLLSLVRSEQIGFLGKENRVCVALSRAKGGFYIVGNMDLLARQSKLWRGIKKCLETQRSIGSRLPLRCHQHQNVTNIATPEGFRLMQNVGCSKKCGAWTTCGHICTLMCHTKYVTHQCAINHKKSVPVSQSSKTRRKEKNTDPTVYKVYRPRLFSKETKIEVEPRLHVASQSSKTRRKEKNTDPIGHKVYRPRLVSEETKIEIEPQLPVAKQKPHLIVTVIIRVTNAVINFFKWFF